MSPGAVFFTQKKSQIVIPTWRVKRVAIPSLVTAKPSWASQRLRWDDDLWGGKENQDMRHGCGDCHTSISHDCSALEILFYKRPLY